MLTILSPKSSPRIQLLCFKKRMHCLSSPLLPPAPAAPFRHTLLRRRLQPLTTSNTSSSKPPSPPATPTPPPAASASSSSSSSASSTPPPLHDIRYWKHYIAPTLFAVVTIAGSFVVAASSYERQETAVFRRNQQRRELLRRKLRNDHVDDDTLLAFEWRQHHDDNNKTPTSNDDDEAARLEQLLKQQQDRLDPGKHGGLDYCLGMVHSWARYQWYQLGLFYQDHLQGHGTISWLIGFNLLVFGGWRLLPLKCQPFMTRWFTNHPVWCTGPRNLNLVTASFSHQHLLPLALNMAGLWYFGSALQGILGEQQFLAFYLSSAVAATTVSRWLSLLTRHYRPLMLLPSVISTGAGGAVYGCLAALTVLHPTSTLDLAGKVAIPLNVVLPGLLTLDLTGVLMRWRLFDHYSHLGGAGFGIWYMTTGQEKMWIPLVRKIRDIRDRNERNGRSSGPPPTSLDLQTPHLPWIRRVNKEG